MMTKYQLVFIKLETICQKISATSDARAHLRVRKAFERFRRNAHMRELKNQYRKKLALQKFRLVLSSTATTSTRITQKSVLHGFKIWALYTLFKREEEGIKKTVSKSVSCV